MISAMPCLLMIISNAVFVLFFKWNENEISPRSTNDILITHLVGMECHWNRNSTNAWLLFSSCWQLWKLIGCNYSDLGFQDILVRKVRNFKILSIWKRKTVNTWNTAFRMTAKRQLLKNYNGNQENDNEMAQKMAVFNFKKYRKSAFTRHLKSRYHLTWS